MIKNFTFLLLLTGILLTQSILGQAPTINVYFDIRNEQRIGNQYHFDVYMRADLPGSYLARGMVYVLYDTATFGSSVVSNNKVAITHLNLLDDSINIAPGFKIPKYETFSITDNGSRIVMVWHSPYYVTSPPPTPASTQYPFWFTAVPDTFTSLYHVVMEMRNPLGQANLALDLGLMFSPPPSQQFFFNPNANAAVRNSWILPYGSGVLPASLTAFSGEPVDEETVGLTWSTQRESNLSHFILEKSTSRDEGFREIAEVKGAGDSDAGQSYQFLDRSPMAPVNYYRLKQVNFNGDVAYSETIEVHLQSTQKETLFNLYPNPASDFVNLEALQSSSGPLRFTLMDLTGRPILSGMLSEKSRSQQLNLESLAKGIYLLRVQNKTGQSQVKRLTIQ